MKIARKTPIASSAAERGHARDPARRVELQDAGEQERAARAHVARRVRSAGAPAGRTSWSSLTSPFATPVRSPSTNSRTPRMYRGFPLENRAFWRPHPQAGGGAESGEDIGRLRRFSLRRRIRATWADEPTPCLRDRTSGAAREIGQSLLAALASAPRRALPRAAPPAARRRASSTSAAARPGLRRRRPTSTSPGSIAIRGRAIPARASCRQMRLRFRSTTTSSRSPTRTRSSSTCRPQARDAYARELRRVAARWFVQTPNRWFPIEPHALLPFVHWLPRPLGRRLWRLGVSGDPYDEVRLLGERELRSLFPDAEIVRERAGPFTKSLVAVGPR